MESFACLQTQEFMAFIADNSALGIHRAGYNGVASLIPRRTGNNLFVPSHAGLNYELIFLPGLPPYGESHQSSFEPRAEPMHDEGADEEHVTLIQPETSCAHISARITFRAEEPCYLHQRIELTFHRRFCPADEPNWFRSIWASYMHQVPDRHVYLKPDWPEGDDLKGWVGITKPEHTAHSMEVRRLPDGRKLSPAEHFEAMQSQSPIQKQQPVVPDDDPWPFEVLPPCVAGGLAFYYGLCHGPQLFLMMFKQPERFRLAYSPCGGRREPKWNPAWDYALHLDDAQIGQPYVWDLCLIVKEFQGRTDVLQEVRRYMAAESQS